MACACFTRNHQSSRSVRDAPGLYQLFSMTTSPPPPGVFLQRVRKPSKRKELSFGPCQRERNNVKGKGIDEVKEIKDRGAGRKGWPAGVVIENSRPMISYDIYFVKYIYITHKAFRLSKLRSRSNGSVK